MFRISTKNQAASPYMSAQIIRQWLLMRDSIAFGFGFLKGMESIYDFAL